MICAGEVVVDLDIKQLLPLNCMSADRYERYKAARTLQQVLDLGGSRGDIANDMLRGYIVVEDREIHEAILSGADLTDVEMTDAQICRTRMPAGNMVYKDC